MPVSEIDSTIERMSDRERLMYAMGTLSNAQEELAVGGAYADEAARQLINVAKYVIDDVRDRMPR